MAAFEFNPELSPEEEARFDRLVDEGVANPHDALETILLDRRGREAKAGATTVARLVSFPEKSKDIKKPRRRNTRGGRAYPVPSDSELDPNWNVRRDDTIDQPTLFEDNDEILEIKQRIAEDSRADTIRAMMEHEGLTELEAAARYKARQEIRSRRA